ncbi:MAG TPA: lipopolysaccharide kinase InaA family protein [Phycisphaerae bacterium]|nr:lipopolysaccharide kinase InaA family protein [Phycisphaerae bacterium]
MSGIPRQDSGDAGLVWGGTSTSPKPRVSATHNRFKGRAAEMTQTAFMRTELATKANVGVTCVRDDHQWRIAPGHAALVESGRVDWFHLAESTTATRFKRNSLRDVWRVICDGRAYFAKLYHPNDWVAKAKFLLRGPVALLEWSVGMYAAEHAIGAVMPVAVAWSSSRGKIGPSLLITEAIADVEPLNEYWLRIRDDRLLANALLEEMARLIARAHQCGFQHRDMHPGNILVRRVGGRTEAFFVDLHDVRIGRPVSLREVVRNLAQLNQWFRRHATRTQRQRFLRHYITYRDRYAQASVFARNWRLESATLVANLAVQAERHANKLWAKRDRRTYRDGRYFARIKPAPGWRGHVLLRSKHPSPSAGAASLTYTRQQWQGWLRAPLEWVDPRKHELLKDSHTATVCRATLPTPTGPATVVVKRPLARSFWKRLEHLFGPSRNRRCWKVANMLLNRALPVAQPLAVVERYVFGFIRVDSIGITDYVSASADLETFLTREVAALDAREQPRVKSRLIESLVALLRAFHERGFVHRDFKAPNLLVSWQPPYVGLPIFTFIDMDGISHVRRVSPKQRTRTIVRLAASLLASPACTRADRVRFLRRYLTEPGRTPRDWKDHWRAIDAQVCEKLQDKEARRQWKLERYGRE